MKILSELKRYIWPSAVRVDDPSAVTMSHGQWTLSQERVFMEDLVYKRLTLFLTISAALITGAISLRESPLIATILLFGGTVLCWLLQQTVHRAQLKLDIILQILFADPTHPTGKVNDLFNDANRVRFIGVAVPSGICLILTAMTIAGAAITANLIELPGSGAAAIQCSGAGA